MTDNRFEPWKPCHIVCETSEVMDADELFCLSQVASNDMVANGALDLLNVALMANAIIVNMMLSADNDE